MDIPAELIDKSALFIIKPLPKALLFKFTQSKFSIQFVSPEQLADITFSGYISAFLKLQLLNDRSVLHLKQVTISGDSDLAPLVNRVFSELDLEAEVAKFTGDIIAHRLFYLAKKNLRWQKATASSLQHNVSEYLQEEINLLPPKAALSAFYEDIAELRNDTERLSQRINKLQDRVS